MVKQLKRSLLPPVTADTEEASAHLLTYGVCRLEGALPGKDLEVLRHGVKAAAALDEAEDRAYTYSQGANRRVWSLLMLAVKNST